MKMSCLRTLVAAIVVACIASLASAADPGVGKWPDELGNHRAVVQVDRPADAVWVHLPWRRRDAEPEKKAILVFDASTGKRLNNVVVASVTPACGEIVFQPVTAPGKYYIYYLLSAKHSERGYNPPIAYQRPKDTSDKAWSSRVGLAAGSLQKETWRGLPQAEFVSFEAITPYDEFTSMEHIATPAEVDRLLATDPQAAYLLFPEDREHPIRMSGNLPKRWIDAGAGNRFEGKACRGEFYVFQIGVFAARRALDDVQIVIGDLRPRLATGRPIPASAIRCFNQGGIASDGRPFRKTVAVEKGKVAALWFGVQTPADAEPGLYEGAIRVGPRGEPGRRIALLLEVDNKLLADAGDSELWRHSRLRWLDSTIAEDDEPVAPFTPLVVQGKNISLLGRDMELAATGLPDSIGSYFAPEVTHLTTTARPLLAAPIRFVMELPDGSASAFASDGFEFVKQTPGIVAWRSSSRAGDLRLRCNGEVESDGHAEFSMEVVADRITKVSDLRLEIPLCRQAARYMMGMGKPGGLRPAKFQWRWDQKKHQDSVWLGDVNAGLRCQLSGENYRRPLVNIHYSHLPLCLPPAWHNEGRGACTIGDEPGNRVVLRATSGARTIQPGETLHFNFSLLVTPLKPLLTDAHWAQRYYETVMPPAPEQVVREEANMVTVHHSTSINPYLNYPFFRDKELKRYIDQSHAKDIKVQVYYSTREFSNHAVELWALRSLGDEVLVAGPGGGPAWLQEHLDPPYVPGWCQANVRDIAIVTTGTSRLDNYFLEGVDWLARNVGLDGIYIDDTAFDRSVMKRARKILDRRRPGSLIDFHSWNHFDPLAGYACCLDLYMEHLPYIDRIWIGEDRDYNTPPDYWLVEISGIPFGLMGDMLLGGGNPWRGMIYGMTPRLPYQGDPRPVWKLWDEFDMQGSQMIGYWAPGCPVHSDQAGVLATVYRKPGKSLISIASWAAKKVDCHLTIDFAALGLDPAKARLRAPAIANFQPPATFRPADAIPVAPGRGWLLILDEGR